MPRRALPLNIPSLAVAREEGAPLHRQLHMQLREAILRGHLAPGMRLPSTRSIATDLQVSRNTVVAAFEQLRSEGFIYGFEGSGTFVSRDLPMTAPTSLPHPATEERTLSRAAAAFRSIRAPAPPDPMAPLTPDMPALDQFPFGQWRTLAHRRLRDMPQRLAGYGDPAGEFRLRQQIATHLGVTRAMACSPDQVIVTTGAAQAFDLVVRLLVDPGDVCWIEEPSHGSPQRILAAVGAEVIGVPVDGDGMNVDAARGSGPPARLAYVTPSSQVPLGGQLSLSRRLSLVNWAAETGAWIVEDDYDNELRYEGRPIPALFGLDEAGRTIHVGTFSRITYPGLRIGYAVLPPGLVDLVAAARSALDGFAAPLAQEVLADFIAEGHFHAHVRRMCLVYGERRETLLAALEKHLAGRVVAEPGPAAGLGLVARLLDRIDDREAAALARRRGLGVRPLCAHYLRNAPHDRILLGFAATPVERIDTAIGDLAAVLSGDAESV